MKVGDISTWSAVLLLVDAFFVYCNTRLDFSLLCGFFNQYPAVRGQAATSKTEFIRALEPSFRSNRTWKQLQLGPDMENYGIHAAADAFDGK